MSKKQKKPKHVKEYLKNKGTRCLYCKQAQLEGGHIEVINDRAYQGMCCLACESTWGDIYKLEGVQNGNNRRRTELKVEYDSKLDEYEILKGTDTLATIWTYNNEKTVEIGDKMFSKEELLYVIKTLEERSK